MNSLIGKKIKSYSILKMIGRGQTGTVFQALDVTSNTLVAVKTIYKKMLQNHKKIQEQIDTEIAVLSSCHSPNVIGFVESFETRQFLFIVLQLCNGGSVDQKILTQTITEQEAVTHLKQILNGFKGLHDLGVMH